MSTIPKSHRYRVTICRHGMGHMLQATGPTMEAAFTRAMALSKPYVTGISAGIDKGKPYMPCFPVKIIVEDA